MFSWSTSRQKRGGSSSTSAYPAQRGGTQTPVAQTISGTIRPPGAGQLAYSRQQHIDSYLNDEILKRSTRKVSQDDSTYDTVFQTTSGNALILRVHLPQSSSSADSLPAMTLVGIRAHHAWLDPRMRVVGYTPIESLTTWQSSNLLLGQAVHQVVQHFQLQPPEIIEFSDPGLERLQSTLPSNTTSATSSSTSATTGRTSQSQTYSATPAPPDYSTLFEQALPDLPPIPSNFDDHLQGLSRQDLQNLLDDELSFLKLLHSLPTFVKLKELKSSILDENVAAAQKNLAEKERLEQLHDSVTTLQTTLRDKLEIYSEYESEYNALCKPPDTQDVIKQLLKAKRETLDESEECADKWVESDDAAAETLQHFCDEFLPIRTKHYVHAAKIERLKQQERQQER